MMSTGVVEGGRPGAYGPAGLKGERGSSVAGAPGRPGERGIKGDNGEHHDGYEPLSTAMNHCFYDQLMYMIHI